MSLRPDTSHGRNRLWRTCRCKCRPAPCPRFVTMSLPISSSFIRVRNGATPGRPILQMRLPYIFIADEPTYMSQLPPFQHLRKTPLPGLMIPGRFPINVWPRTLTWAFEWHDISAPLELRRGDPLFYVLFEVLPQSRAIQLVEAERTPELEAYLQQINGVVGFVNQTFFTLQGGGRAAAGTPRSTEKETLENRCPSRLPEAAVRANRFPKKE